MCEAATGCSKMSFDRDLPATERRVPDLDNDIGLVDDLGQRAILESDIQFAVEDHRFHRVLRHIDASFQ